MALKRAQNTGGGGGFVNLKQLVTDHGPALAVFHILEFEPSERGDHGLICPVRAHLRILDGPLAGEKWLDQTFKFAITSALRGVPNPGPKDKRAEEPVNAVGDDLVVHLVGKNLDKANGTVFGNEPSDHQMDQACDTPWIVENEDGELVAVWDDEDDEPADEPAERELVGAGVGRSAGSGDRKSSRPWGKGK